MSLENGEKQLEEDYYSAVLYIPLNITYSNSAEIIYKKQPGFNTIMFIEEAIEKELTVKKSYNGGEVLVLKDYLFKPYIWVLCMLIVWASVALFYVRVGHVDDDLTKVDALSFSSSLTL